MHDEVLTRKWVSFHLQAALIDIYILVLIGSVFNSFRSDLTTISDRVECDNGEFEFNL